MKAGLLLKTDFGIPMRVDYTVRGTNYENSRQKIKRNSGRYK